jgi:hypothetical protein
VDQEAQPIVARGDDLGHDAGALQLEALAGLAARLRVLPVEIEPTRRHVEEAADEEKGDDRLGDQQAGREPTLDPEALSPIRKE